MIGRADIEGSKSNVAMNAWLPQASYPCGNFSDTSSKETPPLQGSIGPAFAMYSIPGRILKAELSPFGRRNVSVISVPTFGHLRCILEDVPPQPNSPPDNVSGSQSIASYNRTTFEYPRRRWWYFTVAEAPTYSTPLA